MKKIWVLVLTIFVLKIATGQTYTMLQGSNGTKVTCSGTFVDGGGASGNYSSDQTSTITFCPSTPGQLIKVTFTSFNTQNATTGCWDYLDVWYGSTTTGTEDDRFCGNRPSFSITSLSPDGCITFRFTSDGSVTRAGWVATISCVTPCANPIAAIVNSSVANLCSTAPTVTVDGSPSTAPGSTVSRYEWNWGDGTTSNSTTPATSHTYTNPGVYLVRLAVRNSNFGVDPQGCRSTNAVTKIVKVMPTPDFTGTTSGPANINCGQSVTLNGSATSQTKVQVTPSIKSGIVKLPDGTGVSYISQLDFTGLFPPGAKVTAGCYPTVKFDLEHSFSADLDIELIAPTGQTVKLFDNHNNQGGVSGISVFGTCVNNNDDGVPGCTASYTVVSSGAVAWTAAGVTTTTTTPCASYSGPCYTTTLTNRPVVYFKPQTFNATQPFSLLDNADLNGVWTLKITDTRALDDGVLNDWSLTFPSSCYGTLETVTPVLSSINWKHTGSGPAVPSHTSTSVPVTNPGPDACPASATCAGNKRTNSVSVGPFNSPGNYVYTLEAQDEFGCKYTRDVAVNVTCPTCNLNLTSAPATINQSLCVNTAITPITYSVSGSATGATVSTLPAGLSGSFSAGVFTISGTPTTSAVINYTVTTIGCTPSVTATGTITVNPPPATPTASVTVQPTCPVPTGTIVVTGPVGGNFEYNVNGGAYQSGTTFSGLAPGNYDVRARNTTTGCVSSPLSLTVNPVPAGPPSLVYSVIDPTCSNITGGIVIQQPIGNNYEYNLNGGAYQSNPAISNLTSGSYIVTVRDKTTGCVSPNSSFTIISAPTPPATPTASVTLQPTCPVPTGTIVVTAPVGASLEYNINGGTYQSGTTFSGLAPNSYSVRVRNTATGCVSLPLSLTVNAVPVPAAAPSIGSVIQPNCPTPIAGSFTITAPVGANLEYSVDGSIYQAGTTFNGLAPNTYNVTVRNTVTLCVSTATQQVINVAPGAPATPTASTTVQPTCTAPTGTIVVTAPVGGSLEYNINGGTYQSSPTFSGLAPGASYSITVRNTVSGCVSGAASVAVNAIPANPATPTASVTVQPTCTAPTGTLVVSAPLGGNLEYNINGGAYQSTTSFGNLTPGTSYSITVRNTATGCVSAAASVTVDAVPGLPATPSASVTVQPTCPAPAGTVVVSAPLGGNLQYSIDGSTYQSSPTFSNLTPGTNYSITVRNTTTGCVSAAAIVTVDPVPGLPATPTVGVTDPTCQVNTGSFEITDPLGLDLEYSIDGLTYQTGTTFSGLVPNVYNVTVRNTVTGCVSVVFVATVSAVPVQSAAPVADGPFVYCVNDPSVAVSATGANLLWYTGSVGGVGSSTAPVPTTVLAGTFRYYVTQQLPGECESDRTEVLVRVNPLPVAKAGLDKQIFAGERVVLNGVATGNNVSILWTPPQGLNSTTVATPTASPAQTTLYTLTVTSGDNCESSDEVLVTILKPLVIPNVFSPNGDGVNDRWIIKYIEQYPDCVVEVFNRYGARLFERIGYSSSNAWDGTQNGNPVPIGPYYYVIRINNTAKPLAGVISIVR